MDTIWEPSHDRRAYIPQTHFQRKSMWSFTPRSQLQGFVLRPQMRNPEPTSPPELTIAKSLPDPYWWASWLQIRQKHPTEYLPYSVLTNHLMLCFLQEFSLSRGYKNRLLKCQLSLELAHCPNSIPSALPGLSWDQPTVPTTPTASLLFVLNKLTPFWNTLSLEIRFQPALGLPQQNSQQSSAIVGPSDTSLEVVVGWGNRRIWVTLERAIPVEWWVRGACMAVCWSCEWQLWKGKI